MPLSKERMRERKRQDRLVVKPMSNLNTMQNDYIPWYNPAIHRAGDRVKVQSGRGYVITTIPELDADGHPVPVW